MYVLPGTQRAALKQAEKTDNRSESSPGALLCVVSLLKASVNGSHGSSTVSWSCSQNPVASTKPM